MASGSKKPERPYRSDRFIPNRLHFNVTNAQHFMQSKSDALTRLSFKNLEAQNELVSYAGGPTPYASALGKLLATGASTHLLPLSERKPMASSTFTGTQLYKTPFFRSIGRTPISDTPQLVLDAPGMMDDYYLNLLDWSGENILAVGLADCVYLWNAETHSITQLMQTSEAALLEGAAGLDSRVYISSVHFLNGQGFILAIGLSNGFVQLWDIFSRKLIAHVDEAYYYGIDYIENTLSSGAADTLLPSNRVSSLSSCAANVLSAGSRYGQIRNYDMRLPFSSSLTSVYQGHSQEVCGLEWSSRGTSLASGGNDNMVFIWDARSSGTYLQRLARHTAAVKAVSWCPWKSSVLATGGGSTDRQLCIWNAMDGQCIENIDTHSQVCCLKWSTLSSELVTAHGYARNELIVWAYPQLTPVATIQAHMHRVLHLALSPDGTTVVSTASDENLKFWKLFECENKRSKGKREKEILQALPPSLSESEL